MLQVVRTYKEPHYILDSGGHKKGTRGLSAYLLNNNLYFSVAMSTDEDTLTWTVRTSIFTVRYYSFCKKTFVWFSPKKGFPRNGCMRISFFLQRTKILAMNRSGQFNPKTAMFKALYDIISLVFHCINL